MEKIPALARELRDWNVGKRDIARAWREKEGPAMELQLESILCVDDDPEVLSMLKEFFPR